MMKFILCLMVGVGFAGPLMAKCNDSKAHAMGASLKDLEGHSTKISVKTIGCGNCASKIIEALKGAGFNKELVAVDINSSSVLISTMKDKNKSPLSDEQAKTAVTVISKIGPDFEASLADKTQKN